MLIHLTARAWVGRPLVAKDAARWLWRALRRNWPDALAACLMPDHVHLLIHTREPKTERQSLAHVLGAFSRHVEPAAWETRRTEVLASPDHVRRTVRYIHLNPCRARLADDPLAWPWSTHRGIVGAEVDPWVTPEHLARALACSATGFARQLHQFVSADPSVSPAGTPFPKVAPRRSSPEVPLSEIVGAAEASTPWSDPATFHRVAVLLAWHQAWLDTASVGRAIGLSPRSVRRAAKPGAVVLLAPATLCLGDARLRRDGALLAAAGREVTETARGAPSFQSSASSPMPQL